MTRDFKEDVERTLDKLTQLFEDVQETTILTIELEKAKARITELIAENAALELDRDSFAAALDEAQQWFTPAQIVFNPPRIARAKAILAMRDVKSENRGAAKILRAIQLRITADRPEMQCVVDSVVREIQRLMDQTAEKLDSGEMRI